MKVVLKDSSSRPHKKTVVSICEKFGWCKYLDDCSETKLKVAKVSKNCKGETQIDTKH